MYSCGMDGITVVQHGASDFNTTQSGTHQEFMPITDTSRTYRFALHVKSTIPTSGNALKSSLAFSTGYIVHGTHNVEMNHASRS